MKAAVWHGKRIQLRVGQANVRRWVDDLMPLLTGTGGPLGVDDFAGAARRPAGGCRPGAGIRVWRGRRGYPPREDKRRFRPGDDAR